jgi:hypothetical protein
MNNVQFNFIVTELGYIQEVLYPAIVINQVTLRLVTYI